MFNYLEINGFLKFILGSAESPPEPAPNTAQPSPNSNTQRRTGRPRLGYLDSECESEPPYLPTMISDTLLPYTTQGTLIED